MGRIIGGRRFFGTGAVAMSEDSRRFVDPPYALFASVGIFRLVGRWPRYGTVARQARTSLKVSPARPHTSLKGWTTVAVGKRSAAHGLRPPYALFAPYLLDNCQEGKGRGVKCPRGPAVASA